MPAVLGAMADDIQWAEADGFPLAGTYVGPQAVLDGVFMRREIGDEFAAVPDQIVAEGDTVVAIGNYTWKHKGSGEPAVVKMVHVGPLPTASSRRSNSTSTPSWSENSATSIGRRGRFTHHDRPRTPGL